ncbi:ferripyochelin binding protein [Deferribacter desulfuricans SSM1]|uniref:Ferripyochelin binding protein n=1 Tax=Deferribacter desulfuricans (strain DSM 14783 / JCM 11476 / NBRC 101012 / SSM1) TaxID=639282 RepID=D3PEG6_DEFDS|nr:gamma carbonic anhydrase family protein [Deferribacter desulfuricans]BAI80989.1 ferripyochelin binding protein [Deferribacter desulfuricans SSM1]
MEKIRERLKKKLVIGKRVFIAESADVIGDVSLGDDVSIWYNVTIRGDVNYIKIGKGSNVQDNSVIHCTLNKYPTEIGEYVTIGHGVVLHGCMINNNCLIGLGAIIMDDSVVSENSIVAAGTLIPPGKKFPPNVLIKGSPAKVVRELSDDDIESIKNYALRYIEYKNIYLSLD